MIERAVDGEDHDIAGSHRVEATLLKIREPLKIVIQRDRLVAAKVVITERGINAHSGIAERRCFLVKDAPLRGVTAMRHDVTADEKDGRFLSGNLLHQHLPANWIAVPRVRRIHETNVAVSHERKRSAQSGV